MASSGRGQVRQRGRRKEGRGDGGEQMREARQEGSRGERPDRKGAEERGPTGREAIAHWERWPRAVPCLCGSTLVARAARTVRIGREQGGEQHIDDSCLRPLLAQVITEMANSTSYSGREQHIKMQSCLMASFGSRKSGSSPFCLMASFGSRRSAVLQRIAGFKAAQDDSCLRPLLAQVMTEMANIERCVSPRSPCFLEQHLLLVSGVFESCILPEPWMVTMVTIATSNGYYGNYSH